MSNLDVSRSKTLDHDIPLHGPEAFAGMHKAGQLAASALDMLVEHVQPGVPTDKLDKLAFEFAMDQLFGMNMQKSGLVDTMWDLIVDGFGALIISIAGWGFLKKRSNESFLEDWINSFIEKNPRLFSKS